MYKLYLFRRMATKKMKRQEKFICKTNTVELCVCVSVLLLVWAVFFPFTFELSYVLSFHIFNVFFSFAVAVLCGFRSEFAAVFCVRSLPECRRHFTSGSAFAQSTVNFIHSILFDKNFKCFVYIILFIICVSICYGMVHIFFLFSFPLYGFFSCLFHSIAFLFRSLQPFDYFFSLFRFLAARVSIHAIPLPFCCNRISMVRLGIVLCFGLCVFFFLFFL